MRLDINTLAEVTLKKADDFLKIKETLTRIGTVVEDERELYQSCHILHKQGRYFILHFEELYKLDGKSSNFSEEQLANRNLIVNLLQEWGLVDLVNVDSVSEPMSDISSIKVISFKDKSSWRLIPKYNIGIKK